MSAVNAINEAIEDVIGMMNETGVFAPVRRGALATVESLSCEVGPSMPETVFLNKGTVIPVDLTVNGKHGNLQTVSQAMNTIHHELTRRTVYPAGVGWEIVDITNATMPQIIGREDNGMWLMASSLTVNVHIM